MNQEKLQYFKHKLLQEKQNIRQSIADMEDRGMDTSLGDSISELSTYDQHPGDVGSEMFERSKDFALREYDRINLEAIDDALLRMENGKYGYCDTCGEEIAQERLEAIPFTTICKRCKEEKEEHKMSLRPVEEDVLEPPFERTYNDGTSDVGFDGEDSWQAVAHWQEDAPESEAGSYYGPEDMETEQTGAVEEVEDIPYEVGDDGVIYQNFTGMDDESSPAEKIDVGIEHREPRGSG